MAALSALFGLVSMVAYGFANGFSQPLSRTYGPAQSLFLRGIIVSAALALAAIPSYHLLGHWAAVLGTLGLGIAGYVPVLAFTHGIKTSRLGIVAPIAGTAPLVTVALASLFLRVPVAPLQWLAIAFVVAANVAVSFDFGNWKESSLFQLESGIPFALVAAIGWGLFYFFLVSAVQALGPWLSAFLVEVGVTAAAGLHVSLASKPMSFGTILKPAMITNGLLGCIGTLAFAVGVLHYNVAIVAALSNSPALVSSLIGTFLFGERLTAKEIAAGAVMVAGVALVSLA